MRDLTHYADLLDHQPDALVDYLDADGCWSQRRVGEFRGRLVHRRNDGRLQNAAAILRDPNLRLRDAVFPDYDRPPPARRPEPTIRKRDSTVTTTVTRQATEQVVDKMLDVLTRAVPDTTSDDVLGARGRPLLEPSWPTISALGHLAPLVEVDSAVENLMLYTPAPIPDGEVQALQKSPLVGLTVTFDHEQGDVTTYAAYTDLARQAERDGARPAVEAVLAAAAAKAANDGILAALAAAATPAADLTAAVQAVAASYGPNLVLIAPLGTADLAAAGLPLIVDPSAPELMVVAALGVAAKVNGPTESSRVVPSRFGIDLAYDVMILGPSIDAGAVATIA